jgi:hypothetical protein
LPGAGFGTKSNALTISERILRMNSEIFGGQFGSLAASPRIFARSARSL